MALGIDDALMAAAAAISLGNTLVEVTADYKRRNASVDVQKLLDEVTITARSKLDDADRALRDFEIDLRKRDVDLSMSLANVIEKTAMWKVWETMRLRRYRDAFQSLSNAAYDASDSIAALARCKGRDDEQVLGQAVVKSAIAKHKLHRDVVNASSVGQAIELLRAELARQKKVLG